MTINSIFSETGNLGRRIVECLDLAGGSDDPETFKGFVVCTGAAVFAVLSLLSLQRNQKR